MMEASVSEVADLPPKLITILEPENRSEREEAIEYCKQNSWLPTTSMRAETLTALDAIGFLGKNGEPYLKLTLENHPRKFLFAHFWVIRFHIDRVELAIGHLARSIHQ